jgi:hypothetical protein
MRIRRVAPVNADESVATTGAAVEVEAAAEAAAAAAAALSVAGVLEEGPVVAQEVLAMVVVPERPSRLGGAMAPLAATA